MPQRELTQQEITRFSEDGVIKVEQAVSSEWAVSYTHLTLPTICSV